MRAARLAAVVLLVAGTADAEETARATAVIDGSGARVPATLEETFRPALRLFTDRDGLPQNTVQSIARDRDGFLWAATQDGLARFDGSAWKVLSAPNHELSNFFHQIVFDEDGALYVGREIGGVARLRDGAWTTWDETRGVPRGRGYALSFAPGLGGARTLWVGTDGGLAYLDADDSFVTVGPAQGLPAHTTVLRLLLATDERGARVLHVGTGHGLFRLENGRFVSVALPADLGDVAIGALFESSDGGAPTLWVGTHGKGVARRAAGVWTRTTAATGLPDDDVQAFAETGGGDVPREMWVGTDGGLARLEGGRWTTLDTRNRLPTQSISSLLALDTPGEERSLWVGLDGGLARIGLGGVSSVDRGGGQPFTGVFAIDASVGDDGGDVLHVGSRGGGVQRFASGVWSKVGVADGLGTETVFSVRETRSGTRRTLWIGTQGAGLSRVEGGRVVETIARGASVRHLREEKADDGSLELWGATGGQGILHLEHGAWTTLGTADGLPTSAIFCTEETRDLDGSRVLWVGTQGAGLLRRRHGVVRTFTSRDSSLRSDSVLSLHVSREGDGRELLWAGTEGGGAVFFDPLADEPDMTVLTEGTTPAIANNTVYQVREDARRRVHLFTNRGVTRLTARSPESDAKGGFDSVTFTVEDGLPGNEFNGGASAVDAHGRIYAGAVLGLAVIDPARIQEPAVAPPLRLESGELRGSGKALLPGASLSHDEGSVAFDFALLSFVHQPEIRYRTELAGLPSPPSTWSVDRRREFTALPSGSYQFRVWARDRLGHVAGPLEVPFSVRKAPWLTGWAFALYAATLALATWLGVRLRLDALTRQNRLLEARIDDRTRELGEKVVELGASERRAREAEDDARSANRAKSVFLSTMSHELRTPLNAILGFSQLLARGRLPAADKESVDVIVRSGEHLLGLINDVLNISKIEAGKLTLVEDVFSLDSTITSLEKMVRGRAQAKGLRLSVEVAEGTPPAVRGDEGKVRQVLLNLLGNALKFTAEGGVALRAGWRDGIAIFEIEDTGPGISPEDLGRLFESFAQADAGRRAKESTGLGLHISRSFARAMGGDVTVRSRVGVGTMFRVELRLPRATAVPLSHTARRVVALAAGEPGRRVLVADDVPLNREILRRLLSPMGFEVAEAASGEDAVSRWQSFAPHIVFMDIRMEGLDGAEATAQIRALEAAQGRPRTCLVALSASAFEEDRETILRAGCDDFVAKPYRDATIFAKLTEHLGVRFREEDEDQPASLPSSTRRVTSKSLDSLSQDMHASLLSAVSTGDVRASREVLELLAEIDPALAADLRTMVDSFRFEEIEVRLLRESATK